LLCAAGAGVAERGSAPGHPLHRQRHHGEEEQQVAPVDRPTGSGRQVMAIQLVQRGGRIVMGNY